MDDVEMDKAEADILLRKLKADIAYKETMTELMRLELEIKKARLKAINERPEAR